MFEIDLSLEDTKFSGITTAHSMRVNFNCEKETYSILILKYRKRQIETLQKVQTANMWCSESQMPALRIDFFLWPVTLNIFSVEFYVSSTDSLFTILEMPPEVLEMHREE